jgi:hypothetical protein
MTERIRTLLLASALLGAASLLPADAQAQAVRGQIFYGFGWRQSLAADAGGLSFRVGAGAAVGPFGIDYVAEHTTDASFKTVNRTYGRGTNWLALSVRLPLGERISLAFGGGPGLGWIKLPGKASAPAREMSAGIHEFVRLDIWGGDSGDVGLVTSIRVEPQHLWQDAVIPGVDHGIAVWVSMGLAFADH